MALTTDAHRALLLYVSQAREQDEPHKATIHKAVILTAGQRDKIAAILSAFWGTEYRCPPELDLKPQHGYRSRVIKDGFSAERYVEWLVLGCSDVAQVAQDDRGRPHLAIACVKEKDTPGGSYTLQVPIRSTAGGYTHVDDVIPKGLKPKQKKAAPSALP